jgi:outer membrane protein assembly factor BamB
MRYGVILLRTHSKFIKMLFGISLLTLAGLMLSACGVAPANNYAGLSTDGKSLFISDQSLLFQVAPGSGTIDWKYPDTADANNAIFASPAVSNGWVYVGTYGNNVYGFKVDGLDKTKPAPTWTFADAVGKGRFIGSPLAAGEMVYAASTDGNLYALGATTGAMKWSFKGRNSFWSQPSTDGKLIFQTGMDHFLYAVDVATGTKRWELDLGGPAMANVVLTQDGLLYTGTLNSEILAVNTNTQKVVWRKKLAGSTWAAPLLYKNNLYFGTDQNKVYILNAADGAEVKTVDAGGPVIAAPVYTQDAVVILTETGAAFSLTLDGSTKAWTRNLAKGNLYSSPVVIGQQVIFSAFQGDHSLGAYDFNGTADEKWNTVSLK